LTDQYFAKHVIGQGQTAIVFSLQKLTETYQLEESNKYVAKKFTNETYFKREFEIMDKLKGS
jgi:hypothetical protein